MKKLLTTGLAALASLALLSPSTKAATTTYAAGDILLGFRQIGGTQDYLIDLGPATQFLSATSPLHFTLSLSDLNAVFGTGWTNDSSVYWGVAGTTSVTGALGLGAKITFVSKAEPLPGTISDPWTAISSSLQGTAATKITNVGNFFKGATASASTMSAGIQATTQLASASNSWATNAAGTSFATYNGGIDGSFANGTGGIVLDLYEMLPAGGSVSIGDPGTLLGQFTINNNAELTYEAVPEPSTYAMAGVGAVLLILAARRRQSQIVKA